MRIRKNDLSPSVGHKLQIRHPPLQMCGRQMPPGTRQQPPQTGGDVNEPNSLEKPVRTDAPQRAALVPGVKTTVQHPSGTLLTPHNCPCRCSSVPSTVQTLKTSTPDHLSTKVLRSCVVLPGSESPKEPRPLALLSYMQYCRVSTGGSCLRLQIKIDYFKSSQ